MKKTKMITKEVEVIEDIICNKCGESAHDGCNFQDTELHIKFGYGSKKDLEEHLSHICEKCYDEFVATFKIPPEIKAYNLAW